MSLLLSQEKWTFVLENLKFTYYIMTVNKALDKNLETKSVERCPTWPKLNGLFLKMLHSEINENSILLQRFLRWRISYSKILFSLCKHRISSICLEKCHLQGLISSLLSYWKTKKIHVYGCIALFRNWKTSTTTFSIHWKFLAQFSIFVNFLEFSSSSWPDISFKSYIKF